MSGFNLPINTTINGNKVFHEGNHDDRGYPHNQLIEKNPLNVIRATHSDGSSHVGKYMKIATITYLINAQVEMRYTLKFNELNYGAEHYLYINITSASLTTLKHSGTNKIIFYSIESTMNGIKTIDIYARPQEDYTFYYFNILFARGADYFGYDPNYALINIKLFGDEEYFDTITATSTETVQDRPPVKTQINTASQSIGANSNFKFYVNVADSLTNCVVSVIPTSNLDVAWMYSISTNGTQLVINVRNTTGTTATIPALTWNMKYESLV